MKKVGESVSISSGLCREIVGISSGQPKKQKYRAQAKKGKITLFRSRPVPDFHPPDKRSAFSESMNLYCCRHIITYKQMFVNNDFDFSNFMLQ